ncbi:CPBP family intramembrane metalloprotease [Desulfosporosinus fructosivorans]|uniref:CPBP family intramembrane metalloprotease n=1 Tax=Desulfosporosinus fructosivorans TaxID=2018669 RepID=A0A4Z0R7X2_9FIRM|nr:type II CAAX endopeptidase family protein [Desulfosporosinus fructosivorans]TGE37706.1 CPBP family intramembrane metalloprotease [Desulfosporosinus fructosivorans]
MNEEIQSNSLLKRNLSWVDLVMVLGGIICIYVILAFGTFWLMEHLPYERILMYLNAFLTQLAFALLIWTVKRIRHWEWADFGWSSVALRKAFPKIMGVYALTWVINISYAIFLYQHGLTPPDTDVYSKLLGQATWYTLILNLILAGGLAPVVEEILFRGIIFGSLQAYFGKWTSAVLSAAVFSALHFQAYGFFPRFMLGMFLVYLYDKYKSLYPAIALHALNNIVATLIAASLLY